MVPSWCTPTWFARAVGLAVGLAVAAAAACNGGPAPATSGDSESEGDDDGCVASPGGDVCACGHFDAPAGWASAPACGDATQQCCDDGLACTCATPRCFAFADGGCRCAAFVVAPDDATSEVDTCEGLVCCNRGTDCECASAVLTCTASGAIDHCEPANVDRCGGGLTSVAQCG